MKKQVYLVLTGTEQHFYFVDYSNAEICQAANPGSEIFSEEIEEAVFLEQAEKGLFEDYEQAETIETETLPVIVEKKTTAAKVTKEQLMAEVAKLQGENEQLKLQPQKPTRLNFEQAAEAFKRKTAIINKIAIFEKTLLEIQNIECYASQENGLDATNISISFKSGTQYNSKEILTITKIEVIQEMQKVAIEKLSKQIKALKSEVETIDFM